jgi:hypothetical protein
LGIIGVGRGFPVELTALFNASQEEAEAINEFFQFLGKNNVQKKSLENEAERLRHEQKPGLLKQWERYVRKKLIQPVKKLLNELF